MRFIDEFRDRVGGEAGDGSDGGSDGQNDGCRCVVDFDFGSGRESVSEPPALHVDAGACSGGDLAAHPACRATVIDALADRDATLVRVRSAGVDRVYEEGSHALLLAAGRFVDAVAVHDPELAARARREPVAVAREAVGRSGPVASLVAECGLAACAEEADGDETSAALGASVAPTVSLGRTRPALPPDVALRGKRDLDSGGHASVYDRPGGLPHYHLSPAERAFSADALAALVAAEDALAAGTVSHGPRAPDRAARHVAADAVTAEPLPIAALGASLRRHTRGAGVLDELFADERVTDAFVSAPATERPVRVVVEGETMTTNVRLAPADVDALTSRIRAASGKGFSRASPTVDAALDGVRVAAVTAPATDGRGFAFRRRAGEPWTLPRLVAVGSLSPWAAGVLSVAVERGAAILVAGPRGAGKTSLLGALCFELAADTRTVLIEDTPEVPVSALRRAGRDVQPLHAGTDQDAALSPTDAVRTALRLGEGALVVGEVRGREARALYEAMRVGAAADAVLGTIHGTGGAAVRERVVSDLGVPASSFATTDLVVTLGPDRALASIEEVRGAASGDIAALAERGDAAARPTGAVDRGESHAVAAVAGPDETYADVHDAIRGRERTIRTLADARRTRTGGIDAVGGR